MWMMDSSSIFIHESDSLFIFPLSSWWSSKELDVLYHLQVHLPWLGRSSCRSSSYNDPYFSKWGPWWFFYFSFHWKPFVLVISSKKVPQLSMSYEILNLLLQIIALVGVMPAVPVEAAILVLIALLKITLHFLWLLQGWVILDLHENLIKWRV